jgi:hypothetical protein
VDREILRDFNLGKGKGERKEGWKGKASLIGRQNINSTLSGPVLEQGRKEGKGRERSCGKTRVRKETKKEGRKLWKRMKRKLGQEEVVVVVRRSCGRRRRNERGGRGRGEKERERKRE